MPERRGSRFLIFVPISGVSATNDGTVVPESMTPTDRDEYSALRATIRERGTTRVWIVLAGMSAWSVTALLAVALAPSPAFTLFPLVVLATAFEITFALHIGVERIGRYLQVFHEAAGQAGWEHRIMAFGQGAHRVAATDALFSRYFALAALLNVIPAVVAAPVAVEWVVIGGGHALFLGRLVAARQAAARQRAEDLARFEQIRRDGETSRS